MLKRFALEQQVWGAVVPFGTGVEHKEKAVAQVTYAAVGTSPLGPAGGSSVPSLGWGGQRGSSLLQVDKYLNQSARQAVMCPQVLTNVLLQLGWVESEWVLEPSC